MALLVTVELTVNTPKISSKNVSSLLGHIKNVEISSHVPLKYVGRWQIGGPADVVVEPLDARAVSEVLKRLGAEKVPFLVIGDGTNLLFDDAGFRGVVLRIGRRMSADCNQRHTRRRSIRNLDTCFCAKSRMCGIRQVRSTRWEFQERWAAWLL